MQGSCKYLYCKKSVNRVFLGHLYRVVFTQPNGLCNLLKRYVRKVDTLLIHFKVNN